MKIRKYAKFLPALLMLAAPGGAAFAAEQESHPLPPGSGLIAPSYWVSDFEKAKKFYVDGVGLKFASESIKGSRRECSFRFDDDQTHSFIILNYDTAPDAAKIQVRDFGKLVIRTSELDALQARLIAAGFKPDPIRVGGGYRIMTVSDPDGRLLQFVENVR